MRVTILTMGSRGDVYPYVALGLGLARAGHRVTIATLEPFRAIVERHSFDFHPLPDPLAGLKRSPGWIRWQSSDASLWTKLRGLRATLNAAREGFAANFGACEAACRNADAIVSSFTAVAGPHIAERRQVFHAWALVQPFTPTAAFPHCLAPFRRSPERVNRATYGVADAVFGWCLDGPLTEWRKARGLIRSARRATHPGSGDDPVLYGFSAHVLPVVTDWPGHVHVTGYWPFHDDTDWNPPDGLTAFVSDGAPLIAVFHGAVTGWRDADMALSIIKDAVDLAGCRAVIVSDRVGGSPERLSASCLGVNWTSVKWLFPRVALVVHHGGAGTTGATVSAGRPSVVLPSCFDQPFWADALQRLGAAPAPLRPARITAPALAAAIRHVMDTPGYARAAARCAARLACEDGVPAAVRILEGYTGRAAAAS